MSDAIIRLIPTDPTIEPAGEVVEKTVILLRGMVPQSESVGVHYWNEIRFVDCGENLTQISCCECGADAGDWWPDAMNTAHEIQFRDLEIKAPCCGAVVSLNELTYDWPAGFARFAIEVTNPQVRKFSSGQILQIENVLGLKLRQVLSLV